MTKFSLKFQYVSLFSISWSLNIILTRIILQRGIDPIQLAFQTLVGSTIFLAIFLLATNPKSLISGSKKSIFGAIISGVIGGGLANIVSNIGLNLSTAANYGFLIKTSTAFVVLLAYLFLKESLSRLKVILVATMLLGSYLISTKGKLILPQIGDIFILLGALGFAVATIINKAVIKKDILPNVVSFYRALMGAIVSVLFLVVTKNMISFNTELLFLIILSSFLQSLIYVYLNKTLSVASASYTTIMSMAVPVIVLLISVIFLKELFILPQIIGAILIIGAGIMTQKTKVAHHD
ncbi:MAG: hypothetical protein COZ34_05245 [Candidatus Pacebacteria bacterium CG_4_10_14_3_um_filter_34_15]|nr:DMT family transporter [Candidatus Paceibacterota bacterium]OIO44163.1 MAG: hypothetical protein AUJ41_03845 [Candidatus Pacebacteria bacterium CG1_02_43_31]PIX81035.1 MAG: hypothetical protein COZ34_05245 [Candidatus Pacebacteria bacterium CG_4_10_14_3_um_filter_34_15]